MKIEFCEPNFCNLNINTNFTLTLSPSANWYQMDKALLYDDKSSELLYTNGANDDTISVEMILDMGDEDFVGDVKLLETNAKTGTIAISSDGISYVTLDSFTNTNSSYHYHNPNSSTDYEYLVTEDGELILTETGEMIELYDPTLGRYIKVTITTTQIPDDEKYIGELYIGRRVSKLETGKLENYREAFNNPRETVVRDYRGRRRKNRVEAIFNATITVNRPSQAEADFYRSLELQGGMYHFFPDPDNATALDQHINIDQIYLVEAFGNYNRVPYGAAARSVFDITVGETKYVA